MTYFKPSPIDRTLLDKFNSQGSSWDAAKAAELFELKAEQKLSSESIFFPQFSLATLNLTFFNLIHTLARILISCLRPFLSTNSYCHPSVDLHKSIINLLLLEFVNPFVAHFLIWFQSSLAYESSESGQQDVANSSATQISDQNYITRSNQIYTVVDVRA